jgi:hypothetical protein
MHLKAKEKKKNIQALTKFRRKIRKQKPSQEESKVRRRVVKHH